MGATPLFSVIIPTYNDAHFLPEALEGLLGHSKPLEIIIVDDGSTDPESISRLKALSDESIQVIRQENAGPAVARNHGIELATAPYILALDVDNKVNPKLLDQAELVLQKEPKVGIVYSAKYLFGEEERVVYPGPFKIYTMLEYNYIDTCAVFRKEVWEQVGGFDPNPESYEDWDFWLQAYSHGWQFHYLNQPLFWYRVRQAQSRNQLANRKKEIGQARVLQRNKELYLQTIREQEAVLRAYEDSYLFPFLMRIKKKLNL